MRGGSATWHLDDVQRAELRLHQKFTPFKEYLCTVPAILTGFTKIFPPICGHQVHHWYPFAVTPLMKACAIGRWPKS